MKSEQPAKNPKRSGCLVKTAWTILIFAIGSTIQIALANGSGKAFPLVSMLMGLFILGVWTWKPGNSDKDESAIQPLDKQDRNEH